MNTIEEAIDNILETHFYSGLSVARKKQWKSDAYLAKQSLTALFKKGQIEARKHELAKTYTEVVGYPTVPLRSKFVKRFTAYLTTRHAALQASLKDSL